MFVCDGAADRNSPQRIERAMADGADAGMLRDLERS